MIWTLCIIKSIKFIFFRYNKMREDDEKSRRKGEGEGSKNRTKLSQFYGLSSDNSSVRYFYFYMRDFIPWFCPNISRTLKNMFLYFPWCILHNFISFSSFTSFAIISLKNELSHKTNYQKWFLFPDFLLYFSS